MKRAAIDTTRVAEVLESLEIEPVNSGVCGGEWIASPSGGELESINPADGSVIAKVQLAGPREYDRVIAKARARSATSYGCKKPTWARWSRSRWVRFWPRDWAKFRK